MPLPALVAVDVDADVLAGVEAQLSRRYASDYRVECLRRPSEALRKLEELKDAAAVGEGSIAVQLVQRLVADGHLHLGAGSGRRAKRRPLTRKSA